ncbi:MlrC C-terminal domain-containing protein [Rouxiella badensis]|uniref:MlrC C-terminal domain-containing protein n=1 Tax=Rouxiella badensis TaxID=1646377 RepID=UPI001CE4040D|nr:MlrC C-terminal domain-containing protein [Rouxiella badensis]
MHRTRLNEAVLHVNGIDVVVSARRRPYHHIADFTQLGLDPQQANVVVVKSGYLSPELAPIARPNLMALSDGVVDQFVSDCRESVKRCRLFRSIKISPLPLKSKSLPVQLLFN